MAGKLDLNPGQAAMGHKLTISEVLAEYLRMERGRLAPKTHARYTEVIVLFTQSLNGYAANSLSQFDRARFDKLFNAEGEQHREFCDMFGPEHILENVGEFLNYFMVSKVMAGADTLRASGTVMKKLAKWLAARRSAAKVDYPATAIGTAIDNTHNNGPAIPNIRNPDHCAEGQRAMGGGQPVGIGSFTAGCATATVERGSTCFSVHRANGYRSQNES